MHVVAHATASSYPGLTNMTYATFSHSKIATLEIHDLDILYAYDMTLPCTVIVK